MQLPSVPPSPKYDAYAHHARRLIMGHHEKLRRLRGLPQDPQVPLPFPRHLNRDNQRTLKVSVTDPSQAIGILGAGPGGLYTALILDSLGLPYQIIEAQQLPGGRLFTWPFPDSTGAPFNYYDVGAMRFPKTAAMNRVFNLFQYPPLQTGDKPLASLLTPYLFTGDYVDGAGVHSNNCLLSFNGVTVTQNVPPSPSADTFKAKDIIEDVQDPNLVSEYINTGVKAIVDDVIGPFAQPLLDDLKNATSTGWDHMQQFDGYSTRSYMQLAYTPTLANFPPGPLPVDVVNWCETFDKSTGWYDRALSETVLEAIAFGWQDSQTPTTWVCINGGAQQIAISMANYIQSQKSDAITFNSRVTSIALSGDTNSVSVTAGSTSYQFPHVISTIPLTVLRTVNLDNAGLSPIQANALRELNYGPSIKIGMQFKTAWWTTGVNKQGEPLNIVGGQTYTDRILRTVVYPSFGDVQNGKTTTLIASYCWTEDAARFGALIDNDNTYLRALVLSELEIIHNLVEGSLTDECIDMKPWSWSHNPYTMGAFAFFGPGRFESLYTSLTTPAASGRLHFAGEAISPRHAWVEGAFDSAWRAVAELLQNADYAQYQDDFSKKWGVNPEWVTPPSKGANSESSVFKRGQSLMLDHMALMER